MISLPVLNQPAPVPDEFVAVDPICGMDVDRRKALTAEVAGTVAYFCCEACRTKFQSPPNAGAWVAVDATGYFCPMCEGVHSDEPASCPKCGMALDPIGGADATEDTSGLRRRLVFAMTGAAVVAALAIGPMVELPLDRWIDPAVNVLTQAVVATAVVFGAGTPYWLIGWQSFRTGCFNMFSLLLVGVGAAWGSSVVQLPTVLAALRSTSPDHSAPHPMLEFEAAAVITAIMLWGQRMEETARRRTRSATDALLAWAPASAHLLRHGREHNVRVTALRAGDRIRIRPGESIPADGVVVDGDGAVDESMLTGESIPVPKTSGDHVSTGTLNHSGAFIVRVEAVGAGSCLGRLIKLTADAGRSRPGIQRLVDRVTQYFVPLVFAASLGTLLAWGLATDAGWSEAVRRAVAVLVCACPCALGLAAPMSMTVAMGRAARLGMLFRDASALERFASIAEVAFDKTGTLTKGSPRVDAIVVVPTNLTEHDLLQRAAAVEASSEHPWARAIVREAGRRGIAHPASSHFRNVTGEGVEAIVEGKRMRAGRYRFVVGEGSPSSVERDLADGTRLAGKSLVHVGENDELIGVIALVDELKPSSRATIAEVRASGRTVWMLTGDRRAAAHETARSLGIAPSQVHAELTPEGKLDWIRRRTSQGVRLLMAGDGLNDGPALSAAFASAAMGGGAEAVAAQADMVAPGGDPSSVLAGMRLGAAVLRNIRQNLVLAFAYNVLAIPWAGGWFAAVVPWSLDPMAAAAAMSVSSLLVILNAMRLNRIPLESVRSGD